MCVYPGTRREIYLDPTGASIPTAELLGEAFVSRRKYHGRNMRGDLVSSSTIWHRYILVLSTLTHRIELSSIKGYSHIKSS